VLSSVVFLVTRSPAPLFKLAQAQSAGKLATASLVVGPGDTVSTANLAAVANSCIVLQGAEVQLDWTVMAVWQNTWQRRGKA
jgi:hypothetical protein